MFIFSIRQCTIKLSFKKFHSSASHQKFPILTLFTEYNRNQFYPRIRKITFWHTDSSIGASASANTNFRYYFRMKHWWVCSTHTVCVRDEQPPESIDGLKLFFFSQKPFSTDTFIDFVKLANGRKTNPLFDNICINFMLQQFYIYMHWITLVDRKFRIPLTTYYFGSSGTPQFKMSKAVWQLIW